MKRPLPLKDRRTLHQLHVRAAKMARRRGETRSHAAPARGFLGILLALTAPTPKPAKPGIASAPASQ